MVELRGALPLLLAGSTGAVLLGVGLTGLSGVDPQLARAADQVRLEQRHQPRRIVPDVPAVPTRTVPRERRLADCPDAPEPAAAAGEV